MSKMRSRIAAMQSDKPRTRKSRFLQFLLLRVSFTYWFGIAVRNLLYRIGILNAKRSGAKVASIGNITTGGTGKTPVTLMLARWLKSRNVLFAILSRGYRSQSERKGLVFNSQAPPPATAVGDEISMIAQKLPGVWFGIGRDRLRNIRTLQADQGIQTFLLDDGFQHRQLHRDLDIVLIDATNPFGNGWPLPSGSLREPLSSMTRADIILITRTESVTPAELASLKERLGQYLDEKRVFEVKTTLSRLHDFATSEPVELKELTQRKCIAFCGIGNPDSFTQLLAANRITVNESIVLDDHHCYSNADLVMLRRKLTNGTCDLLLTTEKDAVKLPRDGFIRGSCAVVEISVAVAEHEDIFWGKVAEVLAC
jgi:tetraacyldisaccharide 4'-kinase